MTSKLGEGTYGVVCASQRDGLEYAVKIQKDIINTYQELSFLTTLQHPGIIRVKEVLSTSPPQRKFYIYQPRGDIDPPTGFDPFAATVQVLNALAYLQEYGVIHCDLKPNNIVWIQGKPVLIDFGLAELYPGQNRLSQYLWSNKTQRFKTQTPTYRAPEIWWDQPYDSRIDVYSLGCCLYYWLTRSHLYNTGTSLMTLNQFTTQLAEVPTKLRRLRGRYPDRTLELLIALLRPQRLFASELLAQYSPSVVGTAPPQWVYPYPLKHKVPQELREPIPHQVQRVMTELGVWDPANTVNDQSWVVLVTEITDALVNMVLQRATLNSQSYIPGGAGQMNLDTVPNAVMIAVYLLYGFDRMFSSQDMSRVLDVVYEYYTVTRGALWPKTLITKTRQHRAWPDTAAFLASGVARVLPEYAARIQTTEWTELSESAAAAALMATVT